MDKIIDKLNKLSLPATILIASLVIGGFYYTSEVNKQKSIEEAKRALNTCLANAQISYSNFWRRECKSQGELTSRCISLNEKTFDEYAKQNNIPEDERLDAISDFYKEKSECSCRLPLDNADRINKSLQDDKDECFKKYPQ